MIEEKIDLSFKGGNLALWKISHENSQSNKNIFLTHGTFSNKKICLGISEYLIEKGFICWILEWRNHGFSSKINGAYNFEIIGKEDVQRVFEYLFDELEIKEIDCVTHSGGGISLIINLIENPLNRDRINKIVLFGCQSFGVCENKVNYFKVCVGKYISKLIGYIPAQMMGRPENEEYIFMKQWYDWNLSGRFYSESGIDYCEAMKGIKIPILSISGGGDKFVSPKSGCEKYLSCFENPKNEYIYCSEQTGYSENYTHSRIIYSKNAKKEIYPKVLAWID